LPSRFRTKNFHGGKPIQHVAEKIGDDKVMTTIHIVFGQQGAGKTTYSRQLADKEQAARFSIDDWMGELYAPDLPKPINFSWIIERVQRCERRIWATAADMVQRGGSAVLDLGFMKIGDRYRFKALAHANGFTVRTHYVTAPLPVRKDRVLARNHNKGETFAFEVTPGMFDFMEMQFEAPSNDELSTCAVFDSQ
jgi:predicted kinase